MSIKMSFYTFILLFSLFPFDLINAQSAVCCADTKFDSFWNFGNAIGDRTLGIPNIGRFSRACDLSATFKVIVDLFNCFGIVVLILRLNFYRQTIPTV
jgi:hypothetical protein